MKRTYQIGSEFAQSAHKILNTLRLQLGVFRKNHEIVSRKIEESPNTIAKRYFRLLSNINSNQAITNAINAFLRDNPPSVIRAFQELLEDECEQEELN